MASELANGLKLSHSRRRRIDWGAEEEVDIPLIAGCSTGKCGVTCKTRGQVYLSYNNRRFSLSWVSPLAKKASESC
jgi:hypothetical protein